MTTRAVRIAAGALVVVAVVFIGLPIAAVFLRVSPTSLVDGLRSDTSQEALVLSLKTTFAALVVTILVGTPVAYVLALRRFAGRDLVATLLELPLVLPPAVAGIALLSAFGARGTVGGPLGLEIPFTTTAVVMAQVFVSSPFFLRQAEASFAALDPRMLEAARASGASALRTFARIAVPLAAGGLVTGAVLAWARALGEFGATLIFAGSFPAVTQTAPLAIYTALDSNTGAALALSAVLVVVSFAVLVGVKVMTRRWIAHS